MCLSKVSDLAKQWITKEENKLVGYKIFDTSNHQLSFFQRGGRVKINKWMKDKKDGPIVYSGQKSYRTGFHIYLRLVNIKNQEWRKVYYKKPVAYGFQCGQAIVVARELFVPSKRKYYF